MNESAPTAADHPRGHWWTRELRVPCATLLAVQLLALLLYPFVEGSQFDVFLIGIFGVLVLVVTIAMVHRTAGSAWVSLVIALPVIALDIAQAWSKSPALIPWSAALKSLFYFYAAVSLVRYMLGDRRATTDELFGAGATFTLLAWAYAYLFMLCQALQPGCFSGATDPGAPRTWLELTYFSFVLLSSTGIGDIMPLSPHARALASLEMFTGVMYFALIVSRLVGMTLLKRAE
jgi:hypothetical protein